MIEIFGKEATVGHFATAQLTVSVLFAIQSSFMIIFYPLMTPAMKAGMHEVRELNAKGFRHILAFTIPISILLFMFPHAILSVFGHNEPEAATALQILVPGYLFSVMFAMPYSWLQYTGQEHNVTIVIFISVSLSIILDGLLIPHYGIQGTAFSHVYLHLYRLKHHGQKTFRYLPLIWC
ncbi:MATE family efflux transporter [Shewanella surugensis]|uniref:Polysaccharide biosynthesis C-terminal domain-containing protein n=1 Tax=Shewanella surugensis TaxID=212020 RepID=A0ABT0L7Z3_9GAMM|nr:polysaccharide biosynthesis C-terminal domain-containing protein [Shewanella surugensis]MCL1123812.1 polysaccharide biosynthesis C-terminal domain-containing protein [Shewanella surugensis]